jgi:starvation-inducible DNA-binding protein
MTRKHEVVIPIEQARPLTTDGATELQHYGTIARFPIALDVSACAASVANLNQLLADTMTLRDLYKKHHWQVSGPTFYQLHLCSTSISTSRASWSTRSPSAFSRSAA